MKIKSILMLRLFLLTTFVITSAGDLKLIYTGGNMVDIDFKMDGMAGLKRHLFCDGIPICKIFPGEEASVFSAIFRFSKGVFTTDLSAVVSLMTAYGCTMTNPRICWLTPVCTAGPSKTARKSWRCITACPLSG